MKENENQKYTFFFFFPPCETIHLFYQQVIVDPNKAAMDGCILEWFILIMLEVK